MSTDSIPHRSIAIDEFLPMVGQTILADCAPKVAELELMEVQPLKHRFGERLPFILIFRSHPDIQLLMGGYLMRCGEWGPDWVYIEPVMSPAADSPAGNYYQAVFN
jgi:hypothetical protein